jgi:hypothetical protein
MDQNKDVLNLDEALGLKVLKVRYQGKEYQIRTVKSLAPEEFGRVMAYGEKFSQLTDADMNANGGLTVIKAIDDVLSIIGPDLPKYKPKFLERFRLKYRRRYALSLQECTAILQFWSENNRSKN